MKRTLLFAALAVLLAGCQDVTQPAQRDRVPAGPRLNHNDIQWVMIDGENYIWFNDSSWDYHTWTASVGGGTAPYSYQWEINYEQHGSLWGRVGGNSSSVTFGVAGSDGSFNLRVRVTDANGHYRYGYFHVDVAGPGAGCGTRIIC